MIRCSACGTIMPHDWLGIFDKETGQYVCDGCYAPELHPEFNYDAYDETDRTARHTDIGEVE